MDQTSDSHAKILYVDDDGDTCELMAMSMAAHGVPIDIAKSFDEAVEKLDQYSVLITDYELSVKTPAKNGDALATMFKALRPDGRVIMVSGWNAGQRPPGKHVDGFFVKPISVSDIVKEVRMSA